ncbi:uncharacterized protein EDB91DRAFT_1246574 [Suillus paluster]|uniref:uncharacterized protein n=1 Tax=Suillus paluster TaxID=48578 RepID=UPI001B87FAE8|nr:uncharacterized protein EDB91DRAFT_1246574 [Suillus paluster]KAG1745060.1 hypothetical protein EDB91DRAFT_1246574 [Suillus paluster]
MVTLTFGILKTFFDLSCPEVRIPHTLLSDKAYLSNQARGSVNAYYELVGDWVFTYKGSKCALNPDGSLKDAKDIVFYNDPDDAVPISTPSSAQPPTDAFSVLLQTGRKPVPLTAGARFIGHVTTSTNILPMFFFPGCNFFAFGSRSDREKTEPDRCEPFAKVRSKVH